MSKLMSVEPELLRRWYVNVYAQGWILAGGVYSVCSWLEGGRAAPGSRDQAVC